MIRYSVLKKEVVKLCDKGEDVVMALVRVAEKYSLNYDQCSILQDAVLCERSYI